MVNSVLQNDIKRHLNKQTISTELPAGTPRRYEPSLGINKHNERIHSETAYNDKYKNLDFSFSKPKKEKRLITKLCGNCEKPVSVASNCVGIICRSCGKYSNVTEVIKYE